MALWDGLVVDPVAAETCGKALSDTAAEVGEQKNLKSDDDTTTLAANAHLTDALVSLNASSQLMSDYINIDNANLTSIVTSLNTRDSDIAKSYSGSIGNE